MLALVSDAATSRSPFLAWTPLPATWLRPNACPASVSSSPPPTGVDTTLFCCIGVAVCLRGEVGGVLPKSGVLAKRLGAVMTRETTFFGEMEMLDMPNADLRRGEEGGVVAV